ncbi:hypothetical protein IE337_04780 [Weissella viridescens]|uniref:hypothetical protein n=1 Tax=Weissella viridescens TaxID=1629 RepID=UPI001745CF02|nr:hypothetical protein [Weissella viridescens]QOD85522.1 hypothetical protein IE337_04780 [Weissella viridescens]WJI90630.1 hypothetical protein PWA48_04770 [Weissella viridescens]
MNVHMGRRIFGKLKYGSTMIASFIFNLLDSLLYSYATAYVVSQDIPNNLIVLMIGGVAAIIVFMATQYQLKFLRLPFIAWMIALFMAIFYFMIVDYRGIASILFVIFIQKIVSSAISTLLSSQILVEAKDVQQGFMNTATLNVFTVLVGFALGSGLYAWPPQKFGILLEAVLGLAFLFILCMKPKLLNLKLVTSRDRHQSHKNQKPIREKKYFVILGIMSSVSVIWIPQLLASFTQQRLGLLWFPFVIPGIVTLLFLTVFKRLQLTEQSDGSIYLLYIAVIFVFLLADWLNISAVLLTIAFSIVQGFSQLTQISIRRSYIEENSDIPTKVLLQTLSINNQIFLVLISLLNYAHINVGILTLMINVLSVTYLFMKKQKYQVK